MLPSRLHDPSEQPGVRPGTAAGTFTYPAETGFLVARNLVDVDAYLLFDATGASPSVYDRIVPANEMLTLPSPPYIGRPAIRFLSVWIPTAAQPTPGQWGRPLVTRALIPTRLGTVVHTAPRAVALDWNSGESRWELTLSEACQLQGSTPCVQFMFIGGGGGSPGDALFKGELEGNGTHILYLSGGLLNGNETHMHYYTASNGQGVASLGSGTPLVSIWKMPKTAYPD